MCKAYCALCLTHDILDCDTMEVVIRNAVSILKDSQGSINLVHIRITFVPSKHIDVYHQLVREHATHGEVLMDYCATEDMMANALIKALGEVPMLPFGDGSNSTCVKELCSGSSAQAKAH